MHIHICFRFFFCRRKKVMSWTSLIDMECVFGTCGWGDSHWRNASAKNHIKFSISCWDVRWLTVAVVFFFTLWMLRIFCVCRLFVTFCLNVVLASVVFIFIRWCVCVFSSRGKNKNINNKLICYNNSNINNSRSKKKMCRAVSKLYSVQTCKVSWTLHISLSIDLRALAFSLSLYVLTEKAEER